MSEVKQETSEVVGVSSSGSKFYTPIEYVYSDEEKCFIPTFGKQINRYEMIQASKPTCDINYIVKRAMAGDATALNVRVPNYADVSNMPDNLNDLHQMNIEAINGFYKLDPAIRNLFNNDVDYFIESMNNGKVNDIITAGLKANVDNESKEKVESDN